MAATTGLVAAYGFDEGSGTTVTDASGNGNTGTITNATWAATGKYGKALQFNGTNALVTIPDAASLHLSTGMTLEAWVNPSTVNAAWRDVIYKGNDNFYLEATSTNASKPDAGMIAGGSYADAFGTAALTANTWSYLTETYDGSTLRLYVNGTQVASTAHTGAIATSTNPLQIGGDSIYGQYFAGLIDEVRVYNVALTAAQIQTDHGHAGEQRPGHDPADAAGDADRDRGLSAARSTCPGAPPPTTSASPATRSSAARAPAAPTSPRSPPPPAPAPPTRTPASAPPPATATASAPPTPPATSAPTPTPPAPPPRRPTRPRRRSPGR